MASLLPFLFLLISISSIVNAQNPLVFETVKDPSTLQYLTKIHRTSLVLDLNAPIAWVNCDSSADSLLGRPISSGSLQCLAVKSKPDSGSGCALFLENKIGGSRAHGDLVEEISAVDLVDRSTQSPGFLFACAPKSLFKGLATKAKGMLGLGRARVSFPSQISSSMKTDWQFTMCLSSSNGVVLVENGLYGSFFGSRIFNSMIYTPLLSQRESTEAYFIDLKSIIIGGKKLSVDIKSTKLSTIVPYTTMESSIYAVFAKAFEKQAVSMNMARTESPSPAPFGLCFEPGSESEPSFPAIELALQSGLVKWRLSARNSVVRVSERVWCLGFLDGGSAMEESIVLGGYQMEDTVLHFNVANSRLGISPSLVNWEMSCSDFKLESTPVNSI